MPEQALAQCLCLFGLLVDTTKVVLGSRVEDKGI